jgi:hypothetical protein
LAESTKKIIQKRLIEHPEKTLVLYKKEQTGGDPDAIGEDGESGEIIFCECSEDFEAP